MPPGGIISVPGDDDPQEAGGNARHPARDEGDPVVQPLHDRIAVGDSLQVAVFGAFETAPLLAPGVVERCDEIDGLFVRFGELDDAHGAQLDALIDSLAPIDLDL